VTGGGHLEMFSGPVGVVLFGTAIGAASNPATVARPGVQP